MFGIDGSVL